MQLDLPDWTLSAAIIPRTALRPTQSPYFACAIETFAPWESKRLVIEKGYSVEYEWIPSGKRFSIWYVLVSSLPNATIGLVIEVEEKAAPGTYTALAARKGYGDVEFLSGIFFDFEANTRPVYRIFNWHDESREIVLTIFGVEESI